MAENGLRCLQSRGSASKAEGAVFSGASLDIHKLIEPYGGEVTADALLIVAEEMVAQCADGANSPPAKRSRLEECKEATALSFDMPAHRAVLWPLSEYFASKFKNWSGNEGSCQITLLVPVGQLNIGRALVATIYDKIPPSLSQQQLLQLLVLSESYRINKVSAAVAHRIRSIPQDRLEWQTVLAMQQLPAAEPLYKPLIAAAEARRMQLLGDLEMVWALEGEQQRQSLRQQLRPGSAAAEARAKKYLDDAKHRRERYLGRPSFINGCYRLMQLPAVVQAVEEDAAAAAHSPVPPHQLLLQLPFDGLVQLLESQELKAESDNTVHYTITRWLQQHPEVTSTEQLRRLANLVRLSHCTPGYLAKYVFSEDSWLLPLYPARLLTHAALASASWHGAQPVQPGSFRWDTGLDFRSAKERQASALHKLQFSWKIPLATIQQLHQEAVAAFSEKATTQPSSFRWQGAEFSLTVGLGLYNNDEDDDGGCVQSLFVGLKSTGHKVAFDSTITVWSVDPQSLFRPRKPYLQWETAADQRHDRSRAYFLVDQRFVTDEQYDYNCAVSAIGREWEEVEAVLRERRLVDDSNCLHATAEISRVV